DDIGLGGEHIRPRRFARPVSARPLQRRMAEAHASGGNELVFGQRPAISLAKLKQRAVGKPTVAVSLCSGDESWQEPRPHLRELRRDRVAQGKLRRASTEKLRLLRRDE